jgi:16S rRNA A1518/A1519 N6-dimethyltransferase RsmA/KsgA/DIM1 with predicted DNA glycosylase/AP lyase activity
MKVNPKSEELGLTKREKEFIAFLKLGFGQKRKTLANNLKTRYPETEVAIRKLNLRADARAEALSLPQLASIFLELSAAPAYA